MRNAEFTDWRWIIKKIIRAMLMLTIFSVLTRCLGFIYKIYLTKIMTTTELGIYNLSISIYMVLITLVGASIPLTISKITASNIKNKNSDDTKYSVTSSLILTTVFSVFLALLILISKPLITLIIGDSIGYLIIVSLIPSIIFTAIYSQIRGYLWGLENYFAVSIVEFVEQILRIGFCIIFAMTGVFSSPIIAVCVALSIACGLSTFYGLILYIKNNGKFKYKKGYFKGIIKSTLPLTGVRLFGSLLQPLIAIIIPFMLCNLGMSKDLALSELGIVMGMTMPLLSIPSTLIGAMCMIQIPRLNSVSNNFELKRQINNYLKFTLTCIFMFIPIFLILSTPLCTYVYSNIDAGFYMTKCSWIIIPLGLSQLTTSILNALNQENRTFVYYIFSCIIMIALTFILPKFIGIQTMLVATGTSSIILFALNLQQLRKMFGVKTNIFKSIIYHALVCIPVIILTNFCYNIFSNTLGAFMTLIFTGIVSVLGYFGLLFVFGILDVNILKDYIIAHFKNKQKVK